MFYTPPLNAELHIHFPLLSKIIRCIHTCGSTRRPIASIAVFLTQINIFSFSPCLIQRQRFVLLLVWAQQLRYVLDGHVAQLANIFYNENTFSMADLPTGATVLLLLQREESSCSADDVKLGTTLSVSTQGALW